MTALGEAEARSLNLFHRSVAAAGASVVSAFVVNPLDVVKTRIQAQGAAGFQRKILKDQSDTLLEKWSFATCDCVRIQQPSSLGSAVTCGPACGGSIYTGTIDGLRKIARREGLGTLWRGTDVALMMAIPMVGIYLPLYDYLLQQIQQLQRQHVGGTGSSPWSPLVAGALARSAAVYATAPFELVRTRLQAAHAPTAGSAALATAGVSADGRGRRAALLLQHMPSSAGGNGSRLRAAGKLWTGVGATLARDVPFSALYWGLVEPIRAALLPPSGTVKLTEWQVFTANVTAGALSGGLAGMITTPFDVMKTRAQLSTETARPLLSGMRSIAREEGVGALFRGWSARSAKAAPACAIVLSSYEMIKHIYE